MIKRVLAILLYMLRLQLGLAYTPVCIHEESCTRFAARQIKEQNLITALFKIGWRIFSCNPIAGIFRYIKKESTRN